MANYTIVKLEDVPDILGDYPGEMRFCTGPLDCEQAAFTYRRMPQHTGGKGGYGHRHKTQEEIYFVAAGELQFKLEDEVVDVGAGSIVRVAPEVLRSVWNDKPEDVHLVIVSKKIANPEADGEIVENFWPA